MSEKSSIVFSGGIFRDLVAFAPKFPRPGETVFGDDFLASFGGKSANQSVACANLSSGSCPVSFVGAVGDDENGGAYRKNLLDRGVDVSGLLQLDGSHTGVAAIFVESTSGENQIIVVKGASEKISEKDIQATSSSFSSCGMCVCALEMSPPAILASLRLARSSGARTVLNAAPAPADPSAGLMPDILAAADVLCVNETEAEVLLKAYKAGTTSVGTVGEAKEACKDLIKAIGSSTVIITLGSQGAAFATKDGGDADHVPSPSVANPVDTTGAGDAFVGALAYFMHARRDLKLKEAVRRSCVVASYSVQKAGTQQSYPLRSELTEDVIS